MAFFAIYRKTEATSRGWVLELDRKKSRSVLLNLGRWMTNTKRGRLPEFPENGLSNYFIKRGSIYYLYYTTGSCQRCYKSVKNALN
ncbi:hypothetical protein BN1080_02423 [Planococcus massiliensis]|uniref:Uncharacterized protein n=1 Tax=Planococcus massiliensis TaxID=1499687 RepID=A0A098ENP6_9BACL|nr:hypothetical protein BN1080_02423 [Planococcus massiliensis]